MGLVVFAVMGFYLLISIGVMKGAIAYAREKGKSKMRWGWGASLVMYLIPFWDLLPTIIADQYNCANNAGFFVYKSVDKWKELNPGVFETLSLAHLPPEASRIEFDSNNDRKYRMADGTIFRALFDTRNELMWVEYKKPDGETGYRLNERFRYLRSSQGPGALKLSREEYVVFDSVTNEVMARQVDFRMGTKGKIWNTLNDSGWKVWFSSDSSCYKSHPEKFPSGGIHRYINSLRTDCTSGKDSPRLGYEIRISCQ
jgi:hypothetical protein